MTNILISGLGGVGGYYGAKLALAYADSKDVSIFDKPTRVVIETEAGMFLVLLREAIAVAQANGIDVSEEICRQVLDRIWKNDLTTTTSMHRDFMAGGGRRNSRVFADTSLERVPDWAFRGRHIAWFIRCFF